MLYPLDFNALKAKSENPYQIFASTNEMSSEKKPSDINRLLINL